MPYFEKRHDGNGFPQRKSPAASASCAGEDAARFASAAQTCFVLRIGTAVMLVVFIFCVLLFGHTQLKAENFRYLVKYIGGTSALDSSFYGGISYTGGDNLLFGLYKGDVCILDGSRLDLYGISGKQITSEDTGLSSPVMTVGEKYLCLWENGGHNVVLYNSFSEVFSKNYTYPVSHVCMADNGAFAVATGEYGYKCVVYVYNEAFIHAYTWRNPNGYLIDFALSDDGRYLSVLTLGTENGIQSATLSVLDTEKGDAIVSETREGVSPLAVRFFQNGTVCAVFSDTVLFYNRKGKLTAQSDITGTVQSFFAEEDRAVLISADGTQTVITLLEEDGKAYSCFETGKVRHVAFCGSYVLLQLDGRLVCMKEKGKALQQTKTISLAKDVRALLVLEDGAVLVCYGSETELISDIS